MPENLKLPAVGESSIPKIDSKVDLPQPEGPIMATNSPCLTVKLILLSAVVSMSWVRKTRLKLVNVIILNPYTFLN